MHQNLINSPLLLGMSIVCNVLPCKCTMPMSLTNFLGIIPQRGIIINDYQG